jgi:hypothetical protein
MKKILIGLTLVFVVLGLASLSAAQESLVLYENFNKPLDPSKWFGKEVNSGNATILDSKRVLAAAPVGKQLNLMCRAFGALDTDVGTSDARTQLVFQNGEGLNSIQATIQIKKYTITGCDGNDTPGKARVRIAGFFFNAESPIPGSLVGDVMAILDVRRGSDADANFPPGTFGVYATVVKCTNADCSTSDEMYFNKLGWTKVGSNCKLLVRWDKENVQFFFQLNNGAPNSQGPGKDTYVYEGILDDTNLPSASNGGSKRIEAQLLIPKCTADPRPTGLIDANIDNVFVNESFVLR